MPTDNTGSPARGTIFGVIRGAAGGPVSVAAPRPVSGPARKFRDALARERDVASSTVVLVTGPVAESATGMVSPEDVAEITLDLAAPWCSEGKRVAVVDLFWGSGAFLNPLSGEREEGVGDLLLFGSSFGVIERKTGIPGLTLIPAGAGSPETLPALEGEGMKSFVAGLRERYEITFLCGAIPVEAKPRHSLLDWVDGWVGVVPAGAEAGEVLGASYGTVERALAPAPAPPVPRLPEIPPEVPMEKRVQAAAAPVVERRAARSPRRVNRSILAALLVIALGVPGAILVWWYRLPGGPHAGRSTPVAETVVFPKPEMSERSAPSVADEPGRGQDAGSESRDETGSGVAAAAPGAAGPASAESERANGGSAEVTAESRAVLEEEAAAVGPPASAGGVSGGFAVHVSSYQQIRRAETEAAGLEARGFVTDIVKVDLGERGTWYRVRVGSVATRDEANALARRLQDEEGYEYARVVKR